jgi:hypothetical protein
MQEDEGEEPMNQISLRPPESDSGSHAKTHLILSFFFFFKAYYLVSKKNLIQKTLSSF